MRTIILLAASAAITTAADGDPLVIAPMIQGGEICDSAVAKGLRPAEAEEFCRETGETTSARLERALSEIGPPLSPDGDYALGYTLSVPLLRFFERRGDEWVFDRERLAHTLKPLEEVDRPAVVYLFSTHFGIDRRDGTLEQILASDDQNLMTFPNGEAARDIYFQTDINPWTIANKKAPINQYRREALRESLATICELPLAARERVAGINLLGEVHHFFPNFFSGMGYEAVYTTTDYSASSVDEFRGYLRQRFGSIEAANRYLRTTFSDFEAINPPSKDIRTEPLNDFSEHLDAYAHGEFPVFGWAAADGDAPQISVYLNGSLVASGQANAGRQDAYEALPELGTANVGFRFDVPFADQPPGIHTVTITASAGAEEAIIATRQIVIMDRAQSEPSLIPSHPFDMPIANEDYVRSFTDYPKELQSFFYNPLAKLWLDFRNSQVADYIEDIAEIADESCFTKERLFSHQIAPRMNASWNPNLMAVDDSLKPSPTHNLGINLYGGAAYGTAFFDWISATSHSRYGVPEFHPMRSMSFASIEEMFRTHRDHGAAYIAPYFVTMLPEDAIPVNDDHQKFMISPTNSDYGSNNLFYGIRAIMIGHQGTDNDLTGNTE